MPTYEFFCNNCNSNFEKWFSISEEHKTNCPGCGSENVRKVFSSGAGILFKGSGFYCTDYKNKNEKKNEKKETTYCSTSSECKCSGNDK